MRFWIDKKITFIRNETNSTKLKVLSVILKVNGSIWIESVSTPKGSFGQRETLHKWGFMIFDVSREIKKGRQTDREKDRQTERIAIYMLSFVNHKRPKTISNICIIFIVATIRSVIWNTK
jgi:hypothetical protein